METMNRKLLLFFLVLPIALSCQSELENTYSQQESQIDRFITQNMTVDGVDLRVERNAGSNRLILTEGSGEELGESGSVTLYYAAFVFSGGISVSNLVATNHFQFAEEIGWLLDDADYGAVTLNMSDKLIPGLKNGLKGVKSGEEAIILFSGEYGYGNKAYGNIPAKSALAYRVWILDVSNK